MNISAKRNTHRQRKQICGCHRGGNGGGIDWEFGISRCKLLYIEWLNKSNCIAQVTTIQYPVINDNGKEYENECVYTYMYIFESLCSITEIDTIL